VMSNQKVYQIDQTGSCLYRVTVIADSVEEAQEKAWNLLRDGMGHEVDGSFLWEDEQIISVGDGDANFTHLATTRY
jgi:hypothetical protein